MSEIIIGICINVTEYIIRNEVKVIQAIISTVNDNLVINKNLIPILTVIISGFISYYIARKKSLDEIKKSEHNFTMERKSDIYNIKKEAIFEALTFLDVYLSWHTYDSGITPEREETSSLELTLKARDCFNKLFVTCNNEEIIKCFSKIIFNKKKKSLSEYANFRNAARKELGLDSIVEFDPKYLFYSKVSTQNIHENSDKNDD